MGATGRNLFSVALRGRTHGSHAVAVATACDQPQLKRQLSAPRFRLKGQGWYETDFKKDNQRNLAGEKQAANTDSKSDHKTDGKSDHKTDGKSDHKTDKKSATKSTTMPSSKSSGDKASAA